MCSDVSEIYVANRGVPRKSLTDQAPIFFGENSKPWDESGAVAMSFALAKSTREMEKFNFFALLRQVW